MQRHHFQTFEMESTMKKNSLFLILILSITLTDVNAQADTMIMTMDHSHLPIAAPGNSPQSALSLTLTKDAMSGYNLKLHLQHYKLMPPPSDVVSMADLMSATLDKQTGFIEGHAHLYINGEKVQRVYGLDVHLPAKLFKQGINTVSVTLNNHGHMYWTIDKKKVVSTLYIDSSLSKFITHKFESFPVVATKK
jgi:hypothetical protein